MAWSMKNYICIVGCEVLSIYIYNHAWQFKKKIRMPNSDYPVYMVYLFIFSHCYPPPPQLVSTGGGSKEKANLAVLCSANWCA